jgi:hypothetical protein
VLEWFITNDRTWATDEGLRVGDPTDKIRQLYPCRKWDSRRGIWMLAGRAQPTTEAEPRAGKVWTLRATFFRRDELGPGTCPLFS